MYLVLRRATLWGREIRPKCEVSTLQLLSTFEVPQAAAALLDRFLAADEVLLIEALDSAEFSVQDAVVALEAATREPWPVQRVDELLRSAYRRGVLELVDDTFTCYRLGTFYGRLSVFVVSQPDTYLALPAETRSALDAWCFGTYVGGLGHEERPTSDRVLTLAQTLEFIDTSQRPIWLNRCDCRTLAGDCGKPTDTCVTFKSGINTLSHRGWSRPLSKTEAKAVVTRANKVGLMQTVNDNGICNCCSDCCYLFRAQAARGTGRAWPLAEQVAAFDADVCTACLACVRRCPFEVFELVDGRVVQHAELCRGCGLCVDACRFGALEMRTETPART